MIRTQLIAVLLLARAAFAAGAPADDAALVERWLEPGRAAAARGEFAAARDATRAALADATRRVSVEHWGRAYLLNDLARWEAAAGQRPAALGHAREALTVARAAFAQDPARVAYFALDTGVLEYESGNCAVAETLLAQSLAPLAPSSLRERTALTLARLVWARGDVPRARALARAAAPADASDEATLLLAQLDLDSADTTGARRRLDEYRTRARLGDEAGWPAAYLEAEIAYSMATADFGRALARARRVLDAAREPLARANAQHRIGQALSLQGRFADAEAALSEAARGFEDGAGGVAPAAANVFHDLAWLYRQVGDFPRSEFYFDRALQTSNHCASDADLMPALMLRERALLRIEQGRPAQALADLDAAARRLADARTDTRVLRGLVLAARAFAADKTGDATGSASSMQAALALIRAAEGAGSINLPLGFVHLADLAYRGRSYEVARAEADRALAILEAQHSESIWGSGVALSVRGAAQAARGRVAGYWSDAAALIGVTERSLAPAGGAGSANQTEIALARRQVERLLDALPAGAPDLAVLGRLMQLPHVSDATASVQAAALESADLPPNVRAKLRERATLLERSQALRGALSIAQQRGQAADAAAVDELNTVLARLARADAELVAASPAVAGQLVQRSIALDEVRARLRPREGVLLQVATEEKLHALLITAAGVEYRAAALPRTELRANVRRLRRALDLSEPPESRLPFDAARAHQLYRAALGGFSRNLADCDSLVVVADDALQSLPWSVLVTELDAAGEARAYLVDRMSVGTVPSLQSFVSLRASPRRAAAERPYAAFADPRMETFRAGDGQTLRGREEQETLELMQQLAPLPESAQEVRRMAELLGASRGDVYSGARATEKNVRAAGLARYRIISFATHGLMAGEVPGISEPALVLTRARGGGDADDGLLLASDIARLELRADLVILSACNTGRINARAGVTGISGLARGFFAAGARSLYVSHWSVASDATALLLARAVELMKNDPTLGKADALRQAMSWMRKAGAGADFAHPKFWGAFSVVGEIGA